MIRQRAVDWVLRALLAALVLNIVFVVVGLWTLSNG